MSDIEQHCVSLIIKRIVGCDDDKAIEAAAMIDRYYTAPGATTKSDGAPERFADSAYQIAEEMRKEDRPSDPSPTRSDVMDAAATRQIEWWLNEISGCNERMWNGSRESYFGQIAKGVDKIRSLLDQFEIRRK